MTAIYVPADYDDAVKVSAEAMKTLKHFILLKHAPSVNARTIQEFEFDMITVGGHQMAAGFHYWKGKTRRKNNHYWINLMNDDEFNNTDPSKPASKNLWPRVFFTIAPFKISPSTLPSCLPKNATNEQEFISCKPDAAKEVGL